MGRVWGGKCAAGLPFSKWSPRATALSLKDILRIFFSATEIEWHSEYSFCSRNTFRVKNLAANMLEDMVLSWTEKFEKHGLKIY